MIRASQARTSSRKVRGFLVVLVAVVTAILLGAAASASAVVGAGTRVGVFDVTVVPTGGPPEHVSAGQHRGRTGDPAEAVVDTGGAANAAMVRMRVSVPAPKPVKVPARDNPAVRQALEEANNQAPINLGVLVGDVANDGVPVGVDLAGGYLDDAYAMMPGFSSPTPSGLAPSGPSVMGHTSDDLGEFGVRACGLRSFAGDTLVVMADGSSKPIKDVEVGDKVLATDPVTGEQAAKKVTAVWVHYDTLTDLQLDDGTVVATTEDHPFWNATDRQFADIEEFDPGDEVLTNDWIRIEVTGLDPGTSRTDLAYNLTVAGIHTYHVGITGVLVHNTNGCEDAANNVPTVTFSRSRAPGIAQNFDNAVANGAPTSLTRVGDATRKANRRAALRGQPRAPAGQSLDEYPFACSAQGGCGSFVRSVPVGEQNYQGGVLSRFFQDYGVNPGDPFNVMFGP